MAYNSKMKGIKMCKMKFSNSAFRWLCETHNQEKGDKDGCLIGAREDFAGAISLLNEAHTALDRNFYGGLAARISFFVWVLEHQDAVTDET